MKLFRIVVVLVAVLCIIPVLAWNAPAEKEDGSMQILRDKLKVDKKLIVAENMELTESEARGFWPIYEAYQKDLDGINKRIGTLIRSYADAWNTKSMNNEKARKMTSDFLVLQTDEAKLMQSYVPKLNKVLPAVKVARYLQIENKIRAIVRYELAADVPLVPGK